MKLKVYIPYILIFLICFIGGLVIAFGWHKIVEKNNAVPLTTNSKPAVSRSAGGAPALLSKATSTAITAITPTAHPAPKVQGISSAQTPVTTPGCDIILLIDSSGSMKHTDPGDYRKNAAKLFISLLDSNDRIGVMGFGNKATLLQPLTQNSGLNRRALFDAVEKITSKELYTNITGAIQQGLSELETSHQRNRIMIMMSDGRIDLGSRERDDASHSVLMGILPELARKQIPLYTVAFTEESDRALLENMAKATGGSFRFAGEDKDVHVMFASIFEKIKAPDAVPFVGDSFTIDRDIREATVLITKKPGTSLSLMDPSGTKHTAKAHGAPMAWFESSVFDMITIETPAAGMWNVKLSTNEGNKVYVLTSLHLKSSFDGHDLVTGQTVTFDAWLEKAGGIVLERALLENTTFSAAVTGPDGKTSTMELSRAGKPGESRTGDGTFVGTAPFLAAGDYTVNIIAAGKTFQRRITVPFKVIGSVEKPARGRGASQSAQTTAREEVSWVSVLVKFGMINLAVIGLAVALFGVRIMIIKMRTRR